MNNQEGLTLGEQDKSLKFTEQGIKNIASFSDALKKIHIRLISEGYKIENGKVIEPAIKKSENSGIINQSNEKSN